MVYSSQKTREGPVIQFLGLFDTVKRADDRVEFDLSYSSCIKRVRHALAMNEDRYHFLPQLYNAKSDDNLCEGSPIQAWFVGTHADIGGGTGDDGLSLYPLQWMLIECQKYGLVLKHKPERRFANLIANPLSLVFPDAAGDSGSVKSTGSTFNPDPFQEWHFEYANGVEVTMFDLRATHAHGNMQKWQSRKLQKRGYVAPTTHRVRLHPGHWIPSFHDGKRPVFDATELVGYIPNGKSITINVS
jgi:uncharacterized protein (DUF2235 family)